MATTMVNFRMDAELKKNVERICEDLGMSLSTAITIFAKKMVQEGGIPFSLTVDPFYRPSNIGYLEQMKKDVEAGRAKFAEHDLIEED